MLVEILFTMKTPVLILLCYISVEFISIYQLAPTFSLSLLTKDMRGHVFASFHDVSIRFWNCSDSVVFWNCSDSVVFWNCSDSVVFWNCSDSVVFWNWSDSVVFSVFHFIGKFKLYAVFVS